MIAGKSFYDSDYRLPDQYTHALSFGRSANSFGTALEILPVPGRVRFTDIAN